MSDYKLSDRDYQTIYEEATRSFIHKALHHREKYGNFMVRCVVDAFVALTGSKNIMVKDGTIYVPNEQQKENEEC